MLVITLQMNVQVRLDLRSLAVAPVPTTKMETVTSISVAIKVTADIIGTNSITAAKMRLVWIISVWIRSSFEGYNSISCSYALFRLIKYMTTSKLWFASSPDVAKSLFVEYWAELGMFFDMGYHILALLYDGASLVIKDVAFANKMTIEVFGCYPCTHTTP